MTATISMGCHLRYFPCLGTTIGQVEDQMRRVGTQAAMRLRWRVSGWSRRRSSIGIDQKMKMPLAQRRLTGPQTLMAFQCCRLEVPRRHAMYETMSFLISAWILATTQTSLKSGDIQPRFLWFVRHHIHSLGFASVFFRVGSSGPARVTPHKS